MKRRKDIYILGIHDGHNAGAALIKNGKVIAAIHEERLTLVKNQAGTPLLSIQKVLDIARIDASDIHAVAIASYVRIVGDPNEEKKQGLFQFHSLLAPYLHNQRFIDLSVKILHRLRPRTDLFDALNTLHIRNVPVVFIEHHLAHAAAAYYQKPWKEETLIMTLDGMGDGLSATVNIGKGHSIERIATSSFFDSPANNIYSEITRYLGMKKNEHEYKVMGLAPYGDATQTIEAFSSIMRLNPKNPLQFQNQTTYYMESLQRLYAKVFRYKRFDAVAAGAQIFFETLVISWIQAAIRHTGIHTVAVSGGGFLNVKMNMRIRSLPEVKKFFVYPAADDSGLPVGAALAQYVEYCRHNHIQINIPPLSDIYYGAQYTSEQIEEFLKEKKYYKKAKKTSEEEIVAYLQKGYIIGRLSGRDEWGPRALGNRSIIADPRRLDIVIRLNQAIKHRDFWMPFAPAILEEDQPKYVLNSHVSPYMTEAFIATDQGKKSLAATVHPADHTTRSMTVNSLNTSWRNLIREYKKKTDTGALLNTSFNLHGYPMVSTPEQALWTFEESDLDGLLLEDWLLLKKGHHAR